MYLMNYIITKNKYILQFPLRLAKLDLITFLENF